MYPRPPKAARPKVIRTLRADEPEPEGEPRRYPDRDGYIRLRWRVAPNTYVEVREHRHVLVADDDREVHHLDRNPSNNDPDNLLLVTPDEHRAIHAEQRRKVNLPLAVAMHRAGRSTIEIGAALGVDPSNVYRQLARLGAVRSMAEAGALRRSDIDSTRVRELHAMGLNAAQIARLMGVRVDALRGCLHRLGLVHRAGRPSLKMRALEDRLRA